MFSSQKNKSTMQQLHYKTAIELVAALANQEISAVELLEASITRIEQLDEKINAVVGRRSLMIILLLRKEQLILMACKCHMAINMFGQAYPAYLDCQQLSHQLAAVKPVYQSACKSSAII